MKNLSKGEMVFRVMVGILVIVSLYIGAVGTWILWILAAVLIITGIAKYCPVCQIVDKPKLPEGGI
ncbi:MAG: DUF2892 domain-containing protein [Candidatus Woesearchaeota archaeon]